MSGRVPHLRIVVGFCAVALAIYAGFSIYVVAVSKDPALTGDVIGTWKSFAVAVMAFWVGSSSAGKAKDGGEVPKSAADAAEQTADAAAEKAEEFKP